MRIRFKLIAAFLAIASLVAAAGYIAQRTGRDVKQQMERLSNRAIRQMAAATHIRLTLYADQLAAHSRIAIQRRQDSGESAALDRTETPPSDSPMREGPLTGSEQSATFPTDWTKGRTAADLADLAETAKVSSAKDLTPLLLKHQQQLVEFTRLLKENVDDAERLLLGQIAPLFEDELLPKLDTICDEAEREFTSSIRRSERALMAADTRRGILLIATAAAAISIGLFLARSIGKPLSVLQAAAQNVGRGRLDTRVAISTRDEIGALAVALNQMAMDLQEQTVSKDYLDNIICSMRDMLIVTDADLRIHRVNPAACSELGYQPTELLARPLPDLFLTQDLFGHGNLSSDLAAGTEIEMQKKSGEQIPAHCSAAQMVNEEGRSAGVVFVASNITRQKETEKRLRDSLREKNLLLKEVHHRVKNNLQVISSLLNLQADQFRDPNLIRVFQESQARVRSMALIHEQLYRSDDLAHIDFGAYVQQLTDHLQRSLSSESASVSFSLDLRSIWLPIDLAIPCGMIVNELVSNSLTHAFPDRRDGKIRIKFYRDGCHCRLTVADNGAGMQEPLVVGKATSMGLKVVQALTRQVHGTLDYQFRQGSEFTIHFEWPEPPPPDAYVP